MEYCCDLFYFLRDKNDGKLTNEYLAALAASIHIFSAGISYGWVTPSLPRLMTDEYPFEISKDEASYVAIVNSLGFIVGCVSSSILIDVVGRKKTILVMTSPQIVSYLLIYLSYHSKILLYLGRISGGLGEGSAMSVVCLYVAEIASPSRRGVLVNVATTSNVVAVLVVNVLGSAVDIFTVALACLAFPALQLLAVDLLPESPYFLLMRRDAEGARASLRALRRRSDVEAEAAALKGDVERQMSEKGGYGDLFGLAANRKALFLMVCFRFFHMCTGFVAVGSYAQVLFESLGIPAAIGTTSIMFFNMIMFMSASFFIDRYGRKVLLVAASAGVATFLLAMGAFFLVQDTTSADLTAYNWSLFVLVAGYYACFSAGVGPVVTVFAAELFSASVKGEGATVGGLVYAAGTMATVKYYQASFDRLGRAVPFLTFALLTAGAALFYVRAVPETKGETLEAIQEALKGGRKRGERVG